MGIEFGRVPGMLAAFSRCTAHSLRYKNCFERRSPDFIKRFQFLSMKAKDSSAHGPKVSFVR